MSENGIYQSNHVMRFTERKWYECIKEYSKRFIEEAAHFIPFTGTLWGFAYILTEAMDSKTSIGSLALPVIITALLAVLYKAWLKFKSYTPEALQDENETTRNIYRKRKCGWPFALAEQMLANRIENIDLTLNRIKKGAEFIEPKYVTADEYYNWLKLRPAALKQLVRATMIQCTDEIPALLSDLDESEAELKELKIRLTALVQLYEHTMRYETECYQIVPQEPYIDLHKMTFGWTEPIQRGIYEFMGILHSLSTIDRKLLEAGKVQPPNFKITVQVPENISEFCRILDDITSSQT